MKRATKILGMAALLVGSMSLAGCGTSPTPPTLHHTKKHSHPVQRVIHQSPTPPETITGPITAMTSTVKGITMTVGSQTVTDPRTRRVFRGWIPRVGDPVAWGGHYRGASARRSANAPIDCV